MNNLTLTLMNAIIIGLGATLTFDLWGLFLKHTFKLAPSNMCMIGRWVLYMPQGIFRHSNIGSMPQKDAECIVGWIVHYATGIMFAVTFLVFAGGNWLQHPTLISALIFGMISVCAPFFIMQPALGFGIASSRTSDPTQARLRSLMNHIVFGLGLYIFGQLLRLLL